MVAAPVIIRIVRILAFVGGASCLYAGTLLYEDELGRVQNKLEEWWVRFDDQQKLALSKGALFMRATATLTGKLLDGVFGREIISFRSLTVSAWFSLASVCGVLLLFGMNLGLLAGTVVLILLGCLSFRFALPRILIAGFVGLLAVVGGWELLHQLYQPRPMDLELAEFEMILFPVVVTGGVLCDLGYITLTRHLLRWTESLDLASASLTLFISNIALGTFLFLWPSTDVFLKLSATSLTRDFLEPIGLTNAFSFLISLLLTVIALVLLLHRILWPTAARLLYVVAPSKTQKFLLVSLGFALLTFALGKPLSDKATELLKGVSGGA